MLTTLAAGATVLLVAVGAYVTVRMQLQATLDDSLTQRATKAAESEALAAITNDCEIPSWALGAADVRIAFIDRRVSQPITCDRAEAPVQLGEQEADVATGASDGSIRTLYAAGDPYRVVAVPTTPSGTGAGDRAVAGAPGGACSASSGS